MHESTVLLSTLRTLQGTMGERHRALGAFTAERRAVQASNRNFLQFSQIAEPLVEYTSFFDLIPTMRLPDLHRNRIGTLKAPPNESLIVKSVKSDGCTDLMVVGFLSCSTLSCLQAVR
jgi:hypothetical protein